MAWMTGLILALSIPGSLGQASLDTDGPESCLSEGNKLFDILKHRKIAKDEALAILKIAQQRRDASLDLLPGYPLCPNLDDAAAEVASSEQTSILLAEAGLDARSYVTGSWMIAVIFDRFDNLRELGFYDSEVVRNNARILESDPEVLQAIKTLRF